jgi:MFS transporter, SP family, solute carrier family 2 (myo-inositol transporter), member 13
LSINEASAAILFFGMLFCPESPRWLIQKGQSDAARRVLQKLHLSPGHGYTQQWLDLEFTEIAEEIELEKTTQIGGWAEVKALFTIRPYLRRLLLGCGLQVRFLIVSITNAFRR